MAEVVKKRLNKVLTELNISMDRAVEYLAKKGIKIDPDPNAKIAPDVYQVLAQGFEQDKSKKQMIEEVNQAKREEKEKQRIAKELQMAAQAQKEEQQRALAVEKQPQPVPPVSIRTRTVRFAGRTGSDQGSCRTHRSSQDGGQDRSGCHRGTG